MVRNIMMFGIACLIGITAPITVAVSMTQSPQITKEQAFHVLTQVCAASLLEYRRYGTTKFLDKRLENLSPDERNTVELTCYAYAQGYEDGKKWSRVA